MGAEIASRYGLLLRGGAVKNSPHEGRGGTHLPRDGVVLRFEISNLKSEIPSFSVSSFKFSVFRKRARPHNSPHLGPTTHTPHIGIEFHPENCKNHHCWSPHPPALFFEKCRLRCLWHNVALFLKIAGTACGKPANRLVHKELFVPTKLGTSLGQLGTSVATESP